MWARDGQSQWGRELQKFQFRKCRKVVYFRDIRSTCSNKKDACIHPETLRPPRTFPGTSNACHAIYHRSFSIFALPASVTLYIVNGRAFRCSLNSAIICELCLASFITTMWSNSNSCTIRMVASFSYSSRVAGAWIRVPHTYSKLAGIWNGKAISIKGGPSRCTLNLRNELNLLCAINRRWATTSQEHSKTDAYLSKQITIMEYLCVCVCWWRDAGRERAFAITAAVEKYVWNIYA